MAHSISLWDMEWADPQRDNVSVGTVSLFLFRLGLFLESASTMPGAIFGGEALLFTVPHWQTDVLDTS